jgi:hypothetical protein
VLAYGAGGALETIREHETGAFFREQTVEALVEALSGFDAGRYDPQAARANAARFDISVFKSRMHAVIADAYARHQASLREAGRARAGLFATADASPGPAMPDGAAQGAAAHPEDVAVRGQRAGETAHRIEIKPPPPRGQPE